MENVLVCGYGCHFTESLKKYLDFVALALRYQETNLLITSGGCSNQKTLPGISEADLMASYLENSGVCARFIREREALTTIENLRLVAGILSKTGNIKSPLTIFCDRIRRFKIEYMARRIFTCPIKIEAYDFKRSFKARIAQTLLMTPVEIAAFHVPALERGLRAYRFAQNQTR